MSTRLRLEAIGPHGEACIIIRSGAEFDGADRAEDASRDSPSSYTLATGDRLRSTDDPKVFVTLDRNRRFRLR